MSANSGTVGRKVGGVVVAIAWGVATVIVLTIAGVVVGSGCSSVGLVHGETATWFPLIMAFYGFLTGLAIGPVATWKRLARNFGVPRKATWSVAIGLLVIIPSIEYAVLRSPSMTGPSSSTSRLNIEAVSNDGNFVIITLSRDDSSVIYKVDTHTGRASRLTGTSDFEEGPDLSADDKQVVFVSRRQHDDPPEIVLCDIDGSNLRPLVSASHKDFAPLFSHNGKSIYFARDTSLERYARGFEIYSVKVDGTELKRVTQTSFGNEEDTYSIYPESISSDETLVLMNARTKAGDKLLIYSLADQSRAPVVIVPKVPNAPAQVQIASAYFTADGKGIMFMAASQGTKGYDYDVYQLDLSSHKVKKLTSTNGYATDFKLSANGENIAFFTWSLSRLNSVPINPRLQLLNIQTGNVSSMTITGLP